MWRFRHSRLDPSRDCNPFQNGSNFFHTRFLSATQLEHNKQTSIRFKILAINMIKELLGTPPDYEKMKKLTFDSGLDEADMKACLAVILYLISNAAKYNVPGCVCYFSLEELITVVEGVPCISLYSYFPWLNYFFSYRWCVGEGITLARIASWALRGPAQTLPPKQRFFLSSNVSLSGQFLLFFSWFFSR